MPGDPRPRRGLERPVVPDRLDLRDRPFLPQVGAAPPPALGSPAAAVAAGFRVGDQRHSGACVGFALANLVDLLLVRAGRRDESGVSPFMLHSMAQRYDLGTSLRAALKGWYKHGACARGLWPTAPMPAVPEDPARDWYLDAARRPLGAYYRVETRSIADLHVALAQAGVVVASAILHPGWLEGRARSGRRGPLPAALDEVWTIPRREGRNDDAGHAFVIVGYDADGLPVGNSWGRGWGSGGFARLTYEDWLEHAMDAWVAQLGVVTHDHRELAGSVSLRTGEVGGSAGAVLSGSAAVGRAPAAAVRLAADPILRNRELAPFIVDLAPGGALSQHGDFRTGEDDLRALVEVHIATARRRWAIGAKDPVEVALYLHGGLVDEDDAAAAAARWIPTLYERRIVPVFVMWESDLWSTLQQRLSAALPRSARPDEATGLRDAAGASSRRAWRRLWDQRVERTLAPLGRPLWAALKENARLAATARGGGIDQLLHALARAAGRVRPRLHLVAHSAGAVVAAELGARRPPRGLGGWESLTLLAPALTTTAFIRRVLPALAQGRLRRVAQVHLGAAAEQADPTCRGLLHYNRSLLHLVAEAFEGEGRVPLLGLEADFEREVAPRLAAMAEEGRAAWWSSPGDGLACATHGGFDDDPAVLERVVEVVHGTGAAGAGKGGAMARRQGRSR